MFARVCFHYRCHLWNNLASNYVGEYTTFSIKVILMSRHGHVMDCKFWLYCQPLPDFTCCSVQSFVEQNIVIVILETVKDITSVLEGKKCLSVFSFLCFFFFCLFHSAVLFTDCVMKVVLPCKCTILLIISLAFFFNVYCNSSIRGELPCPITVIAYLKTVMI